MAATDDPETPEPREPAQTEQTPRAGDLGMLEGLATTRAIRRYTDEPVSEAALARMLFAATRAPSGSNRQPFRFIVLTDGPAALAVKRLIGETARSFWAAKRAADGYDTGSGARADSPKSRLAAAMGDYVDQFERVPVLVLGCLVRHRAPNSFEGASIYPACQNLLLAAHALGYGGVLTGWHAGCEPEVRARLAIPDDVAIMATITIGRPAGRHGPVRRRPLDELVFGEQWGTAPPWAVDPPGTRHTAAGPPRPIDPTTTPEAPR